MLSHSEPYPTMVNKVQPSVSPPASQVCPVIDSHSDSCLSNQLTQLCNQSKHNSFTKIILSVIGTGTANPNI